MSVGRVRRSVGHTQVETMQMAVFDQDYYQFERERILCRVSGLFFMLRRLDPALPRYSDIDGKKWFYSLEFNETPPVLTLGSARSSSTLIVPDASVSIFLNLALSRLNSAQPKAR